MELSIKEKKTKFLDLFVHFCRHMKLPTIDSLPLCPVFKGAKTNQQQSGEKGSQSLVRLKRIPFATHKEQTPREVAIAPPSR
jgi:hypothetical protein